MTTHESTPNDGHDVSVDDVNVDDVNAENETSENANPEDNDDVSAGEQVLDEGHVTPSQDDFLEESDREKSSRDAGGGDPGDKHAADERTDPGAPPAQEESPG